VIAKKIPAALACLAACAVAVLLFGLPGGWAIPLWPGGPVWHASLVGLAVVCLLAGALVWLLAALVVGLLVWIFASWRSAMRRLVVPFPHADGEPEIVEENPAPELGLIAASVVAILIVSAFMGSTLLLRLLLLLSLGAAAIMVAMQLVSAIGQNQPIELRNRGGGLGGSIGGWRISAPFGLIIVLLILVGAMVGIAQVDRPAAPPTAVPTHSP
jgi:hypothetical protein